MRFYHPLDPQRYGIPGRGVACSNLLCHSRYCAAFRVEGFFSNYSPVSDCYHAERQAFPIRRRVPGGRGVFFTGVAESGLHWKWFTIRQYSSCLAPYQRVRFPIFHRTMAVFDRLKPNASLFSPMHHLLEQCRFENTEGSATSFLAKPCHLEWPSLDESIELERIRPSLRAGPSIEIGFK